MSVVVLMYHRVADVATDAYGLAVHPDRFADHVTLLQRLACTVPLGEVRAPSAALRVAVTFDDGYVDNATVAAPLLESAGLPTTYFITTGRLGGQRFWWDRLAHAVVGSAPLPTGADLDLGDGKVWVSLLDVEAREASLRFLHHRLRPLPPDELLDAVDGVVADLGAPEPPEDERSMTLTQLRALSASTHAEIGAHTRTHLALAGQRPSLQRDEVQGSVHDLEELLGLPLTSFAYPFGTRGAVGDLAPEIARETGVALACSTDPGAVSPSSDPHWLPRLNVQDWTADRLEHEIRVLGD